MTTTETKLEAEPTVVPLARVEAKHLLDAFKLTQFSMDPEAVRCAYDSVLLECTEQNTLSLVTTDGQSLSHVAIECACEPWNDEHFVLRHQYRQILLSMLSLDKKASVEISIPADGSHRLSVRSYSENWHVAFPSRGLRFPNWRYGCSRDQEHKCSANVGDILNALRSIPADQADPACESRISADMSLVGQEMLVKCARGFETKFPVIGATLTFAPSRWDVNKIIGLIERLPKKTGVGIHTQGAKAAMRLHADLAEFWLMPLLRD